MRKRDSILAELEEVAELRRIVVARNNFWEFCKYIDPAQYNDSRPHLKLVAQELQDVTDGKTMRLGISLPPRGGKSYIASDWCAWMLGRNPMGSIMRNTYAATLAEKFSKDIRDGILVSPKYRKVFPEIKLSKKNTAVDAWSLAGNTQPSYFCAGVGGAITGFGCKTAAILDDPIKNIEEALSEITIEAVWNWYTSTHLSRLETGCPEILIATRWSKKDPIGRLTDPDSEFYDPNMRVIVIPALDSEGKSFCEAVKTTEEYHEIRRITDPFIWEAEFMQNPIEEKGLLFPPSELKRFSLYDKDKRTLKEPDGVVGYTDTADLGSDFLCSLIGERHGEFTYITDVVFSQDGVELTEPKVADLIFRNKCMYEEIESNNGGRQYARNIKRLLDEKNYQCSINSRTNTKNKPTRIITQAGYIKEYFKFRDDYLPGSDYDKFFRQLTGYVKLGRNTHDDACDACTGLSEMIPYRHFPKAEPPKPRDDFGLWEKDEDDFLKLMGGHYDG
jgi:predicted phage terminase large subunit-like protein